ncbi:MAG: bifunctional (p)ppGpp synthetase/guanosine-3',5'-bis(diphosphate) 3'-pyrophosphohydrolase [Clostridia bacterium]|nr:bifunctional (p)ppGpp synthetase/guanosine-3',5'-bis(diphosphate) 3'-pyrophosphohydrolase [Clostridia bacterium]
MIILSEIKDATIDDVLDKMKKNNRKSDLKLIKRAYDFAKEKHGDQLRKSGEPYIIHPVQVAYILAGLELDDATICAALLHDVAEDTEVTIQDLAREFSTEIAEMVDGVTKLGNLKYTSAEEQQVENYRKMFLAMGKDIRVILIKLADRLHNMRTLKFLKRDRQIAIAKETQDLYAPLANRLGMYSLKWELEDLAFKYLNPDEFREIVEGIDKKREERLKFINQIVEQINEELKKQKIKAEITGRAKHLYSIYRKMQRDNKSLDQIYDLFALRILVDNVKDCYAALGVVHELYNPMPGRFKDYISVPKPNMYQSLHTTLIGPKGTPFEVQIRTWEMHRIAEFGIAAHWAYKEANRFKKSNVTVQEDKLSWLRETLEWQKDMQDPQEFLNTLKTELFVDEVYVFTPKGQIKVLPRGATPIDFAYSVHAEIGHHMTGCKINSKMMPIITTLKNGDIVEIVTSDQSKGPSRDWLKFVKSTSAKSKIQSWFKKTQRAENIERGKDLIEKEIKKIGISYSKLFKNEYIQVALDRYKFNTIEDMYAAVGFGAISASKIIAKMLEVYKKDNQDEFIEQTLEDLINERGRKTKPSNVGVVVKGIDNCLVRLSKCCNPVPGDDIVGFITRGRGVSVHRKDCVNIKDLISQEDRMIDVYWYNNIQSSYNVEIEILANDRNGLLADIIKQIASVKTRLIAVNSKLNKEKIVVTEVTVEVENLDDLNNILKSLRKIDNVYEVNRKK